MPYLREKPCVDCNKLAELAIRKGGNYYESAERLSAHFKLRPREKVQLKATIKRMLEGSYLKVQPGGR